MTKTSRKPALHESLRTSPLAALLGKRHITKEDVACLRKSDTALGLRSKAEAELIFAIERTRGNKCRAWGDLLVEVLTDFAVWDQRPSGVLSEEIALWLADQVGDIPTPACLALMVSIMDEADTVPAWFGAAVRLRAGKVFGRKDLEILSHAA